MKTKKFMMKNKYIQTIFSKNYMEIFDIFYKNQRKIKIGEIDYYISSKIKMYDEFILKMEKNYKNDSLYIERIKDVIKNY